MRNGHVTIHGFQDSGTQKPSEMFNDTGCSKKLSVWIIICICNSC